MSVSSRVYVVRGINISWNQSFYDYYEKCREGEISLNIPEEYEPIFDCMLGECIRLGAILGKSEDMLYEECDLNLTIPTELFAIDNEYREWFNKTFPDFVYIIENKKFETMVFVDYY